MRKIDIKPDCGNAPGKIFLAELNTTFARGDLSFIADHIPDHILWEIVGQKSIAGKENFITELKKRPNWKVKRRTIDTIITHGHDASLSGQVVTSGNSKFSFCDVYRFKGAGGTTIKSVSTFLIRQKMD